MTTDRATFNEIDAYIAEHSDMERAEFEAAEIAFDISTIFHKTADHVVPDEEGSKLPALFDKPLGQVTLGMIGKYLDALGYDLTMVVTDQESGRLLHLNLR